MSIRTLTPSQIPSVLPAWLADRPPRQCLPTTCLQQAGLTVDEIVATPLEELVQFLSKEGRNHFPRPEAVAAVIKRAAQDSYRPHPALNEPLNLILATTLENIRTLSRQVKKLNQAIEREVRKFPNPLISVPGLGPVLVAGIMAEIQDIHPCLLQAGLPRPVCSG